MKKFKEGDLLEFTITEPYKRTIRGYYVSLELNHIKIKLISDSNNTFEKNEITFVDNSYEAVLKQPKFSIYKTATTKEFYVKYEESDEKQITEVEYNQFLEQKNRMLEAIISEPVMFDSKVNDDIIHFEEMQITKVDDNTGFSYKYGTCYGNFYLTKDSLVLESMFNSKKGNGDFIKTINILFSYLKNDLNLGGMSILNLNTKLIQSLLTNFNSNGLLITNSVLFFKK